MTTTKERIRYGINALLVFEELEGPIDRICNLVQHNQWFFKTAEAGSNVLDAAADKLEELIREAQVESDNDWKL